MISSGLAFAIGYAPYRLALVAANQKLLARLARNAGVMANAKLEHAVLPDLVYVNLEDDDVPDPAPFRNDGYDSATPLAEQLQAVHGSRRWLRPGVRPVWPPDRDVHDVS